MKKLLFISVFAMAAIVACNKDEEETTAPEPKDNTVVISLKSSDGKNGDMCVTVKDINLGTEYDSCFSVGVPFESVSVVVDKIVVKVGEGENLHDSVVYVYQTNANPSKIIGEKIIEVGEGDNRHDSIIYIYEPTVVPPTATEFFPCDTCK